MRIDVFNRWDTFLFSLSEDDVTVAEHQDTLGAFDSLTVATYAPLAKGYRLVWHDARGRWHESIVDSSREIEGVPCYTCLNSILETYGDYIDDLRPNGTATVALTSALSVTRWQIGTVNVTAQASTRYWRTSAREALTLLQETWGGEFETTIEVSGDHITARKLNLLTRRGSDNGKRFVRDKDLVSVTANIQSDDPISRLYGYGKGEQVSENGWTDRIDFASVNGGKKYIEDDAVRDLWGRPDGKGGKKHREGTVIFENCEDKNELLRLTRETFAKVKEPLVSYEAEVVDLESMGFDWEGCDVGDTVAIIDKLHSPEIRVQGRVTAITTNLLTNDRTVEVGNIYNLASLYGDQTATLKDMQRRSGAWDIPASLPSTYLQQVVEAFNEQFNTGGAYHYSSFEDGDIWSSVPLKTDANGKVLPKPSRTPASAIQLKGGGFRIANTVTSDGSFNWRTFGTGDGFTADCITAGTIKGGSNSWNLNDGTLTFKQGTIQSADGKISWNLSNGDLQLGAGTIKSADGNSYWNLGKNQLVTKNMTADSMDAQGSFTSGTRGAARITINNGNISGYSYDNKPVSVIHSDANFGGTLGCLAIRAYNGASIQTPKLFLGTTGAVAEGVYTAISKSKKINFLTGAYINGDGALVPSTDSLQIICTNGIIRGMA